ncbi:HET domain-containing protein [Microdochium nivale]|nr:HET domain-containing protein [Microdochium nivale]
MTTEQFSTLCPGCSKALVFKDDAPTPANVAGQDITLLDSRSATTWQLYYDRIQPASTRAYKRRTSLNIQDVFPTLPSLSASTAVSNCGFCHTLLSALRFRGLRQTLVDMQIDLDLDNGEEVPLEVRAVYHWYHYNVSGSENTPRQGLFGYLKATISLYTKDHNINQSYLHFFLASSLDSCTVGGTKSTSTSLETAQLPAPVEADLVSKSPITFMRSHLDRCDTACGHTSSSQTLPRRLLDLRGPALKVTSTANVLERVEDGAAFELPKYAALSYCWGDPEQAKAQLKLMKADAAGYASEIPMGLLSPVQADAVTLARALSMPFIWIDALCIVQDDKDDWKHEAARMGDVYSNSFVTLCVLSTWSCLEGFLERSSDGVTVPLIPHDTSLLGSPDTRKDEEDIQLPLSTCQLLQSPVSGSASLDIKEWPKAQLQDSKWITRAWTFQEQLLSTRTIHITSTGVHVGCSRRKHSEFGNILEEDPAHLDFSIDFLDQLVDQVRAKAQHVHVIFEVWNSRVMIEYSRREITYETDRMLALSGVARRFGRCLQQLSSHDHCDSSKPLHHYVAGIWTADLPLSISWYSDRPSSRNLQEHLATTMKRSETFSPSWGWIGYSHVYPIVERPTRPVADGVALEISQDYQLESLQVQYSDLKITNGVGQSVYNEDEAFGPTCGRFRILSITTALYYPMSRGAFLNTADDVSNMYTELLCTLLYRKGPGISLYLDWNHRTPVHHDALFDWSKHRDKKLQLILPFDQLTLLVLGSYDLREDVDPHGKEEGKPTRARKVRVIHNLVFGLILHPVKRPSALTGSECGVPGGGGEDLYTRVGAFSSMSPSLAQASKVETMTLDFWEGSEMTPRRFHII